jgi:hypothetical protein
MVQREVGPLNSIRLCTKQGRQSPKKNQNSLVWTCPVLVICQPDYTVIRSLAIKNYTVLGNLSTEFVPKFTAFLV